MKLLKEETPRYKMLSKGKDTLTKVELLANILGTGNSNKTVLELARSVLSEFPVERLSRATTQELMSLNGIGEAKAIAIVSAFELASRSTIRKKVTINSSQDVFNLVKGYFANLDVEHFMILLLNRANNVIAFKEISRGGIHGTYVDPKVVFKIALAYKASGVILCHNHPSGNTNPSEADIKLTERISSGSKNLDLNLFDHIITVQKSFYSFKDQGLIA